MKRILYLGTDKNFSQEGCHIIYYPVISLVPKNAEDEKIQDALTKLPFFTHCFFTSKNAVDIFFEIFPGARKILAKKCVSIGPATTSTLQKRGIEPLWEAALSSQEGIIEEMKKYSWQDAFVFYPRSSLARPLLTSYLKKEGIACEVLDLYDIAYQSPHPIPCLEEFDEIVFTSPSTVKGFFKIFPLIPESKQLRFQGDVTKQAFYSIYKIEKK